MDADIQHSRLDMVLARIEQTTDNDYPCDTTAFQHPAQHHLPARRSSRALSERQLTSLSPVLFYDGTERATTFGVNLVNVVWSSTSVEKERDLLPIRIPLHKGMLGYRVALIAKDKQALIDQVKTLDDLKKLQIGQGQGWGDVQVYEHNGFSVITAQYENLFTMLTRNRFDLFPRGIGEVFHEFETYSKSNPDLVIEQNLLIYYPWPYYFFFNKRDITLKERVEAGIRKMIADGSFDAIFRKYNGAAIEKADIRRRRIINIDNPLLPKETPLNDASLWFDPKKY